MTAHEAFSRHAALETLRPRLWNFLRSHAAEHELGLYVEAIWNLAPGEFEELLATHLALSDGVGAALDGVEVVLPRLPSAIAPRVDEYAGFVHGPVDWSRTQRRRVAAADPTLFVCRPVERRYDTPPARLCHAALAVCAGLAALTGLRAAGSVGGKVHERSERARRLLRHPKLKALRRPRPPFGASLRRIVLRWPQLGPAAGFLNAVEDTLYRRRRDVVEGVLNERLLVPAGDDDLFELVVAFALIDDLRSRGFAEEKTAGLLGEARRLPLASLSSLKYGRAEIWWDRTVWAVLPSAASDESRLRHVLWAAGMSQHPFRPDVVLYMPDMGRLVVIEAKVTAKAGLAAERRGIQEAFAYLFDAEDQFATQPFPHAIVVAWNASGTPAPARVAVCDQHSLTVPLDWLLAQR